MSVLTNATEDGDCLVRLEDGVESIGDKNVSEYKKVRKIKKQSSTSQTKYVSQ